MSQYPGGRHNAVALNHACWPVPTDQHSAAVRKKRYWQGLRTAAEQNLAVSPGICFASSLIVVYGRVESGSDICTGQVTREVGAQILSLPFQPATSASSGYRQRCFYGQLKLIGCNCKMKVSTNGMWASITAVSSSFCPSLSDRDGGLPDDVQASRGAIGCSSAKMT